jgi:hypothetical protein
VNPPPVSGEDRRWANRPVVRETDDRRARWLWGLLFAIVAALVPAACLIVLQAECLAVSYEVNDLRSRREALTTEGRQLQLERARLESLARIEDWADGVPDLVRPDTNDVIVVVGNAPGDGSLLARAPDRETAAAD